jgi:uncharacterized protein YdbL (DUF1318 family)
MKSRTKLLIAATIGIAMVAGTTAYAMQGDAAGQLRATGLVGEQADGYLGLAGSAPANIRAQMEQVNIQRRAAYTQLAAQRGATIEEVAAATACQLFASRVAPGQYYRMPEGVWRTRNGNELHCGSAVDLIQAPS